MQYKMPGSTCPGFCFACAVMLVFLSTQVCLQCYSARPRMRGHVNAECCMKKSNATFNNIVKSCHVQEPHGYCQVKAYVFVTQRYVWCVDPTAPWLQNRLNRLEKRGICCQLQ